MKKYGIYMRRLCALLLALTLLISQDIIPVNALPTITPTAMSITFPRMTKVLNSLNILPIKYLRSN